MSAAPLGAAPLLSSLEERRRGLPQQQHLRRERRSRPREASSGKRRLWATEVQL